MYCRTCLEDFFDNLICNECILFEYIMDSRLMFMDFLFTNNNQLSSSLCIMYGLIKSIVHCCLMKIKNYFVEKDGLIYVFLFNGYIHY
jgi:hypothetical protein